jgi:hypothetical protein
LPPEVLPAVLGAGVAVLLVLEVEKALLRRLGLGGAEARSFAPRRGS